MDNTEEFRCLSLCSGYAGIELGLECFIANFRTIAYVEIDAFACANLVAKIEAGKLAPAPVWTDIKTFNAQGFRNRIHIITAGYPCQGESVAGRRLGERDPRWLWPDIERIIETVRPVWFFGENVPNHLNIGYPKVYAGLRDLGYKVEAGLFTAAECGAPHLRRRLFILAHDKCSKQRMRIIEKSQAGIGRDRFAIKRPNIPDPDCERLQESRLEVQNGQIERFPARPGQPQYEWECPRTVGDTSKRRCEQSAKKLRTRRNNINKTSERQTKSRLGGAVNGTAGRVDRLRLLGNGVVPAQAELAFRTLIKRFNF